MVLETVVRQLKMNGFRVRGYLQQETQIGDTCGLAIDLQSIADGRMFRITQAPGSGSRSCRLDLRALADLCGLLSRELDEGMHVLVLNRFGRGEAKGQGFRVMIEDAFQKGIPVLVAVRDTYWEFFGGAFARRRAKDYRLVQACSGSTNLTAARLGETPLSH